MCGIVAIVSRPSRRPAPAAETLLDLLDRAIGAPDVRRCAEFVAEADVLLHGVPGIMALVGRSELVAAIAGRLDTLEARILDVERDLEVPGARTPDQIEVANADNVADQAVAAVAEPRGAAMATARTRTSNHESIRRAPDMCTA